MKLSRIAAAGAGVVLVGVSVLAGAGAAQAADFYVQDTDFAVEIPGSPYPADWFIGTSSTTVPDSTVAGLELDGRIQILNSTTPTTGLAALVDSADMVVDGNANFQIPMFLEHATLPDAFTTLRPDNFGAAGLNPLAGWTTSGAFGTFTANSSHTIPEYAAELVAAGLTERILAFGVIVPLGETATVASITWAGDTHWFLPVPTATLSPSTTTPSAWAATDVILTATGLIPGEEVIIGVSAPQSTGFFSAGFADVNGNFTFALEGDATADLGTYEYFVNGFDSGVQVQVDLVVTANAVAAAALPNTGADATSALIGAGSLLVAGLGFAVVAMRRRAAANN